MVPRTFQALLTYWHFKMLHFNTALVLLINASFQVLKMRNIKPGLYLAQTEKFEYNGIQNWGCWLEYRMRGTHIPSIHIHLKGTDLTFGKRVPRSNQHIVVSCLMDFFQSGDLWQELDVCAMTPNGVSKRFCSTHTGINKVRLNNSIGTFPLGLLVSHRDCTF